MDESSLFSYEGDDPLDDPLLDEHPRVDPDLPRAGRRQFTQFDETWARRLLDASAGAGMWALSVVLLQRADYWESFPVTNTVMAKAGLGRRHKPAILARLEALGLIRVQRRQRRSPIVTPLLVARKSRRQKWPNDSSDTE